MNGNLLKNIFVQTQNAKSFITAMKEAERETGVHQQKISCVCLGKQKQANGFIWKFANG